MQKIIEFNLIDHVINVFVEYCDMLIHNNKFLK